MPTQPSAGAADQRDDLAAAQQEALAADAGVRARIIVLGPDAPAMALVGADDSHLGADQASPAQPWPDSGRPDRPDQRGGRRADRRGVAEANAGPTDGGDDRETRRGRSFNGPAAARALGRKLVGEDGSGRGADGGRPGRRYTPTLPEAGEQPVDDARSPAYNTGAVPPYGGVPAPPIGTGSMPWLTEPADNPSITAALGDPYTDTGATAMLRPYDDSHDLPAEGPAPSLVRPYARTGGRTKPGHDLDLEALVGTTVNGREAWSSPLLNPEHVQVIGLCVDTTSVAEIAARLSVPIGVARVIIADMVDLGLVEVGKTAANTGDERDPEFLRRVLSGLQRL